MKVEHWDKSKVYGYSDEIMLSGEPKDNTVPVEGNDEVLTREEIYRMFPNQEILIRAVESPNALLLEGWTKAQVLWFHSTLAYSFERLLEMGCPDDCMNWPIFSPEVGGAYISL